jgi:hypothetical protein
VSTRFIYTQVTRRLQSAHSVASVKQAGGPGTIRRPRDGYGLGRGARGIEQPRRGVAGRHATPRGAAKPGAGLLKPLHAFLETYPFERNVFGVTRFPGKPDKGKKDPIAPALDAAKKVCEKHGLVFHLASDRNIVDDLWPNVAAHMWGCRYGIGFFESVTGKLNYNLTIEVGSCLVLGRRLALLKDKPTVMPTDLVGHIYHEVNLKKPSTVTKELDAWITSSLNT